MSFTVTLSTVLVMLAYAVPGYLLVKTKHIRPEAIPAFAALLLYGCAPFQTLYAMQRIEYSPYILKYLGLSLVLGLGLMGGMLGLTYLMFRRRQAEVPYRICTVAAAMGNCGFMGIPLMEALLPEYPQAVAFASTFFLAMTILMWTVISFLITRDRRHVSLKKVFTNPGTIAMAISLALMFAHVRFTGAAEGFITLMNRSATLVCMWILGMRLGCIPLKPMFTSPLQYLAIGLKLIVFPLLAMAVVRLLPVERDYMRMIGILCCVPVGNLVLSFSELLGEGQDVAANVVLLSTLLSLITIPIMLQFI